MERDREGRGRGKKREPEGGRVRGCGRERVSEKG